MIITREKGMRMWGGGSGSTSASGVNGGGGFSLAVEEGEGTGNAYTGFTYESGVLSLIKGTQFVTTDFFNRLFTAYDANGNAIVPNDTTTAINNLKLMVGTWTEQYLSALGLNSEGGGGGTGSVNSIKVATNTYLDPDEDGVIDMSSYAATWNNKQNAISDLATIRSNASHGNTAYGYFTSGVANNAARLSNTTKIGDTNQPVYFSASGVPVAISYTIGKSVPTNAVFTDTTYKLTLNGTTNGASGGTSLGSFYAPTSVGTDGYVLKSSGSGAPSWVAQSTLSVGTAAKLNTGTTTYTAWGQTYWSSGVPQSISGNMTSVGSITPSANGNALGTTSARFNIYGTSGNFSGNVSITGTLGVTGAATLSSSLSVAGGITLTTTKKIYFGDTSHYLELNSTGFHFSHGVYSDSFVSALGANSSGGGGGGIDLDAMWAELQGNTGTYANAKINVNHIPDISSTYGYAKQSWVNTQLGNYVTLNTAQTISGLKTMTHGLVVSGRVYNSGDDEGVIVKPAANGFAGITLGESSGIHTTLYLDSSKEAKWVYKSSDDGTNSSILHPNKNGVIALTSDIPTSLDGIPDGSTRKLSNYLPLTGGTLTGDLSIKFNTDSSRAMGYSWLNTSGTSVASIIYHNTAQNIILNPVGSTYTWSDAVGKYSLVVGNNKLTYNTYTILHSNNYSSYALPLSGGTMTGILKWKDTNALPETTSPTYMLTIDSFANGGTTKWANLTNVTVGKATTASLLSYSHTNEINFKGGMQVNCWFNFRNADTNSEDGGTTAINYKFCNYTASTAYSTVTAGTFVGAFSGNATTATTLQTPRTIWGESFDGSANVSGAMTGVTSITMSSSLIMANNTFLLIKDSNGTPNKMLGLNSSNQYFLGFDAKQNGYTGFIDANNLYLRCTTALYLQTSLVTLNAGARISKGGASGSTLYIGDTNNSGWVLLQDMCSQTGAGDTYWSIRTGGNAIFKECTATSDERKKNILGDTTFSVKDIADTRSILFEWKDNTGLEKKVHGGSIAQDWLGKADWALTLGDDGYYSLNYGALALCSAITIAREVVKHEDRITLLEKENARLKARVAELEERRIA